MLAMSPSPVELEPQPSLQPHTPGAEQELQPAPLGQLTRPHTQALTRVQTQPQTQAQLQPGTEPQTQSQTEPQTQSQTQSQTEPQTQSQTQPQTEPQTEPQTHPQSQTQSQTKPQTEPQTQSQTQPQTEPQTQPQSQTQSLTEPQTEPQTQSQTQPQTEPQSQSLWIKYRRLLLLLWGFSLCAALLGSIYYFNRNQNREQTAPPCLSPACQLASVRLASYPDPFAEPCDYFLFACGSDPQAADSRGRHRGQGIPGHPQHRDGKWRDDRGGTEEKRTDRRTTLLQHLREVLESDDGGDSSAVRKAKTFYRTCLDTRSIETAGVEPLLTLIEKVGGWSVSGQWYKTDFNSTLSLLMRDYATFPFFNLFVGKDPREVSSGTSRKYIQIDQPDLLIPIEWNNKTQKSQKAKTRTLRTVFAACHRYLALLGAAPGSSLSHIGLFMSLSSELAVAMTPLQHRLAKGQLYQRMSIKELQVQAPAIDWLSCLRAAFHPLPLAADDHVLLHNLPYVLHMSHIIRKWLHRHELSTRGPLQTYMVLNLVHTLLPALDSRFSEAAKNLSATDRTAPRWKRCVLETERGFDSVLARLLGERTAHREAEEMIQNIFSSFKSKLQDLEGRDPQSFHPFVTKAQSLIPRLWTSSEIPGDSELDRFFSTVSVHSHSFFSNYVQLLSLWQRRRRKLLSAPTELLDVLSITPHLQGSELLFPMGMFAPPLFHPTYPRAMNYGMVGFLMAKDILHLLLPENSSHTAAHCVWSHYLSVTERESGGGAFSLSAAQRRELWVQFSALQIALQAYQHSLAERPRDTSISGLSHTRLFLSAFSQMNCDSDRFHEFMPLPPSFLITVVCAGSQLCPADVRCPARSRQQAALQTC